MSTRDVVWAFKLRGISPLAKLVAIRIADAGPLTFEEIAEFCGVDIHVVTRAIVELEDQTDLKWFQKSPDFRLKFEFPIEDRSTYSGPASDCYPLHLYVMSCGDRVKIGIAKNVEARRQTIQLYASEEVKIRWQTRGPAQLIRKAERTAHRALETSRIWGEWFSVSIDRAIAAATEAKGTG